MAKDKAQEHHVEVGNPVLVVQKGSRWIGICHAIDSRIEGNAIIKEVKVQCIARKGEDMGFFEPCEHNDLLVFEMKEVFPLIASHCAGEN